MDITFKTRKLAKIQVRLAVLKNARTLSMVPTAPPERLHQLKGKRKGQHTVDLIHPYRLIFEPDHEPLPRRDDGSLDLERVTAVTIIEVVDYH